MPGASETHEHELYTADGTRIRCGNRHRPFGCQSGYCNETLAIDGAIQCRRCKGTHTLVELLAEHIGDQDSRLEEVVHQLQAESWYRQAITCSIRFGHTFNQPNIPDMPAVVRSYLQFFHRFGFVPVPMRGNQGLTWGFIEQFDDRNDLVNRLIYPWGDRPSVKQRPPCNQNDLQRHLDTLRQEFVPIGWTIGMPRQGLFIETEVTRRIFNGHSIEHGQIVWDTDPVWGVNPNCGIGLLREGNRFQPDPSPDMVGKLKFIITVN